MCLRNCAQCYMPPPGSMGVPGLWHRYFGGRGLKSLVTSGVDGKLFLYNQSKHSIL